MMSNYWKNHYNRGAELFKDSLLKQVGKTINGMEVDNQQLAYIAESVIEALEVTSDSVIVDLCCGNGLITKYVAKVANRVIAVDYSDILINTAREKCGANNISYVESDVLNLPISILTQSQKFYMYEALQHFSSESFKKLLGELKNVEHAIKLFIGSVPDRKKLWDYYDTEEKKLFYLQREKENKPHMGNWWRQDELQSIAEQYQFNITFIPQNKLLYTAYYRFNCLLEKNCE